MMLSFNPIGPLLRYENSMLYVGDNMKWPMRRGELFRLGVRCIYAAIMEWRK